MSTFKSFNQLVTSMLERLSFTQPNLDTKPGTVARDLFVDLPADQLEKLYRIISIVAEKQSPETASGTDLDKYASNFGISRTRGVGASGIVVFTTNSIFEDIPIPSGSQVTAKNGVTYNTVGNYIFQSSAKAKYSATANRLKRSLQIAGNNDIYAMEVPVQASRPGTVGNVSSLQILSNNLQSEVKVVNLSSMSGGTNQESDNVFRTRIASVFSGSNTGTSLGYRNAALTVSGVLDALVVEPGNSLMLRDGTETIKVNDGTYRILNSGTGGKVDIYILGKILREVSESFIFRDQSGTGNVTDERNDFVIGSTTTDLTRTSQERRVNAFKTGTLPAQPVYSLVSVYGSQSGLLVEKSVSDLGITSGNYELIKDENPDTGGSPFSFDKLHFIDYRKNVVGENIAKQSLNSTDQASSSVISEIKDIYRDVNISQENSFVLLSDKSYISFLHKPVVNIARIQNKTTGEVYSVESQEIDPETGLNMTGLVKISGKNLPNQSDILASDYTWRQFFDKYVDYNGFDSNSLFKDPNVSNVIDWGVSNGIGGEASEISSEDDNTTFKITVANSISRVVSVKLQDVISGTVSLISNVDTGSSFGIVLPSGSSEISNINYVKTSNGLELYNTRESNGTFSGLTIYLPTDTPAIVGETVSVVYNFNEIYNVENTDASFSGNIITLPSSDVLSSAGLIGAVINASNLLTPVYIDYVEARALVSPSFGMTLLPITGNDQSNLLFYVNSSSIDLSIQPIAFNYDQDTLLPISILKNSPAPLAISITNSSSSGKIKISGTSFGRTTLSGNYGNIFNGTSGNLKSQILEYLELTSYNTDYYISRIDSVYTLDSKGNKDFSFDMLGYTIKNNAFDSYSSRVDSTIEEYEFILPSTPLNTSSSLSSGTKVYIDLVLSKINDFEEIYFSGNKTMYTSKSYARISRVSASSGFRNSTGTISGNMQISFANQPPSNTIYFSDYSFNAPIEGERITVRYNINQLLLDVTNSVENYRPVTADVLVKQAEELKVDVKGTILINDNRLGSTDTILENASNAIASALSTNILGPTVDYADIISTVMGVDGVDSVNISLFNISGNNGRKSYIKALDNQTINPGNITLEAVSRKNFRLT